MSIAGGDPEPGEMFGDYRIVRQIGIGGMGVVFEATDVALNRSVALKIISPAVDSQEDFRARFRQEAKGQAALDSPHVVSVFAHGEVDGRLYIATQLVPDGDLGSMIKANGPPPLRTGLDIIAQMALALQEAHQSGIVHRDIKPPNVLLRRGSDGMRALLADFGIARYLDTDHSLTATGGTIGTPSFMAPELHTGGSPGPTTDVYSLGCLLWCCLVGDAPYAGTSPYQIVAGHMEKPIPQLKVTSPVHGATNHILRTSMAKTPAERYQSTQAMRDDLLRALAFPSPDTPVEAAVGNPGPEPDEEGGSRISGAYGPTPGPPPPPGSHPPDATVMRGGRSNPPPASKPRVNTHEVIPTSNRAKKAAFAVIAVLAVIGLGLGSYFTANALLNDEAEAPLAGSTAPPSDSAPTAPTSPTAPTLSPSPTDSGRSENFTPAQRIKAERSLADALRDQVERTSGGDVEADCVSREWIEDVGLSKMRAEGFFDSKFNYTDPEPDQIDDEIEVAGLGAVVTCTPR